MSEVTNLFEPAIDYPDFDIKERLDSLVGLDDHKEQLSKILGLLINPNGIQSWAKKYYPNLEKVVNNLLRRPPLIVLEGDVGSGKTELATTIGDLVARQEGITVTLLPLSLSTRGQGHVGEMTRLISTAFDEVINKSRKLKSSAGKNRGGIILLVDEADALAQSRESNQMHHEDKAGVNAFIRGIDRLGNGKLPGAVILCTNRLNSLDPAIRRRAAEILKFDRPNKEQRYFVLNPLLKELEFKQTDINKIVSGTGKTEHRNYGYTYSDLTQRLLPSIVLSAYPDNRIDTEKAIEIARKMQPTPPFQDIEISN